MTVNSQKVDALVILDGWGINPDKRGNAPAAANTPFLDSLEQHYPCCRLSCSGKDVGLPRGIMGNSEVGHMNMGAGRKVLQNLVKIDTAIDDGSFFLNREIASVMEKTKTRGAALHLMGLVSDGGVHSQMTHLFALVDMALEKGVEQVNIHCILDGRDTPPKSGAGYVARLEKFLETRPGANIASLCGRYYAMDRDNRWERIEKAYDLYTMGRGSLSGDPVKAVENRYEKGETDEFLTPVAIVPPSENDSGNGDNGTRHVKGGDSLIFFNFRADRARQITRALTEKKFSHFTRKSAPQIFDYLCMTLYDESFDLPVAFGPQHLDNILGGVVSQQNMPQLRIAETEKYAHVTYFFNGGDETVFPGEERVLIPSPTDVATYDEKPEMSAGQVAQTACEKIESGAFRFVVLNFANMDMVGHTGVFEAGVKACETVDQCTRMVVSKIWKTGGTAMVTADHGNAEMMMDADGAPHTAHTLNPVRFILAGDNFRGASLHNGILGDIAPTVLDVMKIDKPAEMTGKSLILKQNG
ncbi:MAG: 2,3-bisphosphoglycerate-independent phosphoglycerate mutase [Desulfobacteraceae bacterium]